MKIKINKENENKWKILCEKKISDMKWNSKETMKYKKLNWRNFERHYDNKNDVCVYSVEKCSFSQTEKKIYDNGM